MLDWRVGGLCWCVVLFRARVFVYRISIYSWIVGVIDDVT